MVDLPHLTVYIALIILTSLVWIVLLCVYIFFEWDTSDPAERSSHFCFYLLNIYSTISRSDNCSHAII
jgi:amino acid permease